MSSLKAVLVVLFVVAGGTGRVWLLSQGADLRGDGESRYRPLALNVLAGRGFSCATAAPFEPDCVNVPGYPLFLALAYLGGSSRTGPVALQLLLELGTLWLLYRLLVRGPGPQAATVAVAVGWLCPMLAVYSRHVLAGPLSAFLSTAYCALLARGRDSRQGSVLRVWGPAGLCAAALVLVRVDAYAFVLVTATLVTLWGRFGENVARRAAVTFGLAFVLGLAPWVLRQYVTCGRLEVPGAFQYLRTQTPYFRWLDTWLDDPRLIDLYGYRASDPSSPAYFPPFLLPDGAERSAAERGLLALKQGREEEASSAFEHLAAEAPARRSFAARLSARVRRTVLTWLLVPALLPEGAGSVVLGAAYASWCAVLVGSVLGLVSAARARSLPLLLLAALLASRTAMPFVGGWAAVTVYLVPAFPAVYGLAGVALAGLRRPWNPTDLSAEGNGP